MDKFLHILFAALFCALACGPAALYCATHLAGADLPTWMTASDAAYLSGGVQEADVRASLTPEGIAEKRFQSAVETEVGNSIPMKARAMLANAALQRGCIGLANAPFGWPCYPTYLGSSRLYIPGQEALTYQPGKRDAGYSEGLSAFGDAVCDAAEEHPEVRFTVYMAGGYQTPAFNPADELVAGAATYDDAKSDVLEGARDLPNASFLFSPDYSSGEEYYADFFRTDHHYNIDGALKAYAAIAPAAGLLPYGDDGGRAQIEGYEYTGATARFGLDLLGEPVFDVDDGFEDLAVVDSSGGRSPVSHDSFWSCEPARAPYAYYDLYYDGLGSSCRIEGGSGTARTLLVSNSYGGALQRPMARASASLDRKSDVHPSCKGATTVRDALAAGSVDSVVFVGTPSDLSSFMRRNPNYFK